jgi:hypothetical protein
VQTIASVTGWELWYPSPTWTLNSERTWHHHKRAGYVKEWRNAFWLLAKEARIPHLDAIGVAATPVQAGKGRTQDVGGCFPAAKAAIDGLVDAGVIDEDSPRYVRLLAFCAPERGPVAGLRLLVFEP